MKTVATPLWLHGPSVNKSSIPRSTTLLGSKFIRGINECGCEQLQIMSVPDLWTFARHTPLRGRWRGQVRRARVSSPRSTHPVALSGPGMCDPVYAQSSHPRQSQLRPRQVIPPKPSVGTTTSHILISTGALPTGKTDSPAARRYSVHASELEL